MATETPTPDGTGDSETSDRPRDDSIDPDDQPEPVTDGGTTACGRRTCDREAAVSYTTMRGAIRTRCDVHALADGVDGIGEMRAEKILAELTLDELVERCRGADGAHAPPALSRIDGLGPTTAATIAENVDQSGVADSLYPDDQRVATDGGNPAGHNPSPNHPAPTTGGGHAVERKTMDPPTPGELAVTVNGEDPIVLSLDAGDVVEFKWHPIQTGSREEAATDGGVFEAKHLVQQWEEHVFSNGLWSLLNEADDQLVRAKNGYLGGSPFQAELARRIQAAREELQVAMRLQSAEIAHGLLEDAADDVGGGN